MKKKIVNHIKIIIIILFAVTILFAILGAFNISTKENMTSSNIDDKPQCYPDIVTSDECNGYASYNDENNDDKYILKTKIVPPKGTACPTEISGPASNYLNGVFASTETASSETNANSTLTTNTVTAPIAPTPEPDKNEPAPSVSPVSSPGLVNDNTGVLKESISQKDKPESCPPCPACERCPEPAFECKKVPNYRSPSIGQYMPMPILTDFSKF